MAWYRGRGKRPEALIRASAWVAVLVLGLIHTVARHSTMNSDGVSYLDIADRYRQGEWAAALNATWSPLYSWVLAGALWPFASRPQWEFIVAHIANLLLYLLAFAAFEYFMSVFSCALRGSDNNSSRSALTERWYWLVLAYALFLWGTLVLVDLKTVTPDMAVVGLNFLTAALIVRIHRQPKDYNAWLALGFALGVAYLTKAAMFLLSGITIVVAVLGARRSPPAAARGGILLGLSFAIVCAPFIVALSKHKGRFTFSDAGKLVYAWQVNGVTPVAHWQGMPTGSGTPHHPTRLLLDSPQVYEFGEPISGTYPARLDPSYWYEGLRVRANPVRILSLFAGNVAQHGWLVLPLLFGSIAMGARRAAWSRVLVGWPLLVVALVGIGMYALVYFESRYVSGLVVILYLAVLAPLVLECNHEIEEALAKRICLGIAAICVLPVLYHTVLRSFQATMLLLHPSANPDWNVAVELRERGLGAGARVALVGSGHDAYWARVARVTIIAEIPDAQADVFWACDASQRRYVLSVLTSTRADAVLATRVAPWADTAGWEPIAGGHILLASAPPRTTGGRTIEALTPASKSLVDYRVTRPCSVPSFDSDVREAR